MEQVLVGKVEKVLEMRPKLAYSAKIHTAFNHS
jgi:hypothetical protein